MKTIQWIVALAGAAVLGIPATFGQGVTLMLTVKKKENTETTSRSNSTYTDYYGGTYQSKSGKDVVSYSVEAINAGAAPVAGVKINWVILCREASGGQLRLVEGARTTDLARGQKFGFETDIVELSSFYRSTYSSSRSVSAELVGYLVEVIVDGKVVASDGKPADIRNKVQEARNAPKRHRF